MEFLNRHVLRILDVNLNRAREAARVIEDYVRLYPGRSPFPSALFPRLKRFRHELASLEIALGPGLLAARNSSADPGVAIDEAGKQRRSPASAVTANMKRLQEALRAIEEYGRVVSVPVSNRAGRLRFAAYTIEKEIAAADRRGRLEKARLYLLLSLDMVKGDPVRAAVGAARGGADAIQLRAPGVADRSLRAPATEIAAVCRDASMLFIVNNRPDLALLCGADGVHLGKEDMAIGDARRLLGSEMIIGATSHRMSEFRRAVRSGADYCSVGPMFPSPTKPALAAGGFGYLRTVARESSIPFFCIGGITAENLGKVVKAGGGRVVVCSAIVGRPNIAASTAAFKRRLVRLTSSD